MDWQSIYIWYTEPWWTTRSLCNSDMLLFWIKTALRGKIQQSQTSNIKLEIISKWMRNREIHTATFRVAPLHRAACDIMKYSMQIPILTLGVARHKYEQYLSQREEKYTVLYYLMNSEFACRWMAARKCIWKSYWSRAFGRSGGLLTCLLPKGQCQGQKTAASQCVPSPHPNHTGQWAECEHIRRQLCGCTLHLAILLPEAARMI